MAAEEVKEEAEMPVEVVQVVKANSTHREAVDSAEVVE